MQQVPGESLQISDICTDLKRFAQNFERIENKHFFEPLPLSKELCSLFPGVKEYLCKKKLGDIKRNMKIMLKKHTDVQSLRE